MFFLSTLTAHGQNKLYIHEKGGATQSFALSGIKKLAFTEDNMFIERNEANTVSFFIEDIAYMGFKSSVNIFERQTENFSIYPNPVTSNLRVEHCETIEDLKVFDLQGKIYLHLSPKKETVNIDMASFAAGIYFLRIVSHNKINTSKVIKNSNN
jgi:hypothetical protein